MAIEVEGLITEQIRHQLIQDGLFYLVSPEKRLTYNGRPLHRFSVSNQTQKIYGRFVDEEGIVSTDLVDLGNEILSFEDFNISKESVTKVRDAQLQWLTVSHAFLSTEEGLTFFEKLLSEKDKTNLAFDSFVTNKRPLVSKGIDGYLNAGTLIRIDELMTEDGRLLACDPNLIPLGYAFMHGFSSQVPDYDSTKDNSIDLSIKRLGKLVGQNGSRFSGIVTTLDYPNWPSHVYTARMIREMTEKEFYVIPIEAVDPETGMIDTNTVANLYDSIESAHKTNIRRDGLVVPGVIVNYCREFQNPHPETQVVNYPGFRVLESQLWNGLISLPGFKSELKQLTGVEVDHQLHRETNIPTLVARLKEGSVQIALSMQNGQINWFPYDETYDQLDYLQKYIATSDRPSDFAFYVKSFATSGKKGVRMSKSSSIDRSERNILKILPTLGIQEGNGFLIQPKVRSIFTLEDVKRLKVDIFLSGQQLDFCGADAMVTPLSQTSSHGGSSTQFHIVNL